jgi:hypothetical protein
VEREDSKTGEVSGEGSEDHANGSVEVDDIDDGDTEWKTDVSASAMLRRQKELSAAAAALVQGTDAVCYPNDKGKVVQFCRVFCLLNLSEVHDCISYHCKLVVSNAWDWLVGDFPIARFKKEAKFPQLIFSVAATCWQPCR